MTENQRIRYITEARAAYEAVHADQFGGESMPPSFELWRHGEIFYVLRNVKRFRDFTQNDLTRLLIHWRALQCGERLEPEEIANRACDRDAKLRLEPLRPVWDAIAVSARVTAMRSRFGIEFFEELAGLKDRDFGIAREMLKRLATDNPREATHVD